MILARLEQADRYLPLHPDFPAAIAFLRDKSLGDLPAGRVEIAGSMYAVVIRSNARPRAGALLEAHRKYIDIQYLIEGDEEIGWCAGSRCHQPHGPYNAEEDAELFDDAADSYVSVRPGEFAIFFPDDAHIPLVGTGEVHKVVVKVPL